MKQSMTSKEIWQWPIIIALISLIGLAAGLFGDGIWDVLSWLALSIPALLCFWIILPHRIRFQD